MFDGDYVNNRGAGRMAGHVRKLSDGMVKKWCPKALAKDSLKKSAYIKKFLDAEEIDYRIQKIPQGDENIIVSFGKEGKETVICCHHDRVPGTPGADDPYSGVSVVLELARELSKKDIKKRVKLISFGAEEYGRAAVRESREGSKYYAEKGGADNVDYVVFVDLVGNGGKLSLPEWDCYGDNSKVLNRKLLESAKELGLKAKKTTIAGSGGDHSRFSGKAKIAWLTRTGFWGGWPHYHDEGDCWKNIKPEHLAEAKDVLLLFIEKLEKEIS